MADAYAPKVIRDFLIAQATLTALTGTRIYGETATPPPGYNPGQGAAICFRRRGGIDDYSDALQVPSVQFKCYGTGGNHWAQVENAYQRRADLVPNLVETVKGAAAFERGTITAVTEVGKSSRPVLPAS